MQVAFLTLDEVLALHTDQIQHYGGHPGLRDLSLLQSAVATPAATFDHRLLHGTLPEMAAAYLFHIVGNRPFIDGNKRTGLITMLAFLGLNGLALRADPDALAELVTSVAGGHATKSDVAVFVQSHTRPRAR